MAIERRHRDSDSKIVQAAQEYVDYMKNRQAASNGPADFLQRARDDIAAYKKMAHEFGKFSKSDSSERSANHRLANMEKAYDILKGAQVLTSVEQEQLGRRVAKQADKLENIQLKASPDLNADAMEKEAMNRAVTGGINTPVSNSPQYGANTAGLNQLRGEPPLPEPPTNIEADPPLPPLPPIPDRANEEENSPLPAIPRDRFAELDNLADLNNNDFGNDNPQASAAGPNDPIAALEGLDLNGPYIAPHKKQPQPEIPSSKPVKPEVVQANDAVQTPIAAAPGQEGPNLKAKMAKVELIIAEKKLESAEKKLKSAEEEYFGSWNGKGNGGAGEPSLEEEKVIRETLNRTYPNSSPAELQAKYKDHIQLRIAALEEKVIKAVDAVASAKKALAQAQPEVNGNAPRTEVVSPPSASSSSQAQAKSGPKGLIEPSAKDNKDAAPPQNQAEHKASVVAINRVNSNNLKAALNPKPQAPAISDDNNNSPRAGK